MLNQFISRCLAFAFQRTFHRADALSVFAALIVPAWYWFKGEPMPDWTFGFVAFLILSVLIAWLFLRLATAPYFVWKEDQQELAQLKGYLTDDTTRRRHFFENAFLQDRADLARSLALFATLRPIPMESMKDFDAGALLQPALTKAILFGGNPQFDSYWQCLNIALRNAIQSAKFFIENEDSLADDHKKRLEDRFQYDMEATKAGATSLIYILTENPAHAETYASTLTELNQKYGHVFSDDLATTLWSLPSPQSPPDTEEKTPPRIRPG